MASYLAEGILLLAVILLTYVVWLPRYRLIKTERQHSPLNQLLVFFWPPFAILTVSCALFTIHHDHTKNPLENFLAFFGEWPGNMFHIALSLYIAAMIIFIPSQLEKNVTHLFEAFQTPLSDFALIHRMALEMLKFADRSPNSRFLMIAATPVFGVELEEPTRREWVNALNARAANGAPTNILCWGWDHAEGARKSALGRLCSALSALTTNNPTLIEKQTGILLVRAWQYYQSFSVLSPDANFSIRVIDEPPFGMILTADMRGQKQVLLFFGTSGAIADGFRPIGFVTKQDIWVQLAEHTFTRLETGAKHVIDLRDNDEKKRDIELMRFYETHYEIRKTVVEEMELSVFPDVFPPDIGTSTTSMIKAIRELHKTIRTKYAQQDIGSIDFGCGCGILTFVLNEYSTFSIGIDSNQRAILNSLENTKLLQSDGTTDRRTIHFLLGSDIMAALPFVDSYALIVVAFNFPFYKSPFNIYNWGGNEGGRDIIEAFLEDIKQLPQFEKIIFIVPEPSFIHRYSVERLVLDARIPMKTIDVPTGTGRTDRIVIAGKRALSIFEGLGAKPA